MSARLSFSAQLYRWRELGGCHQRDHPATPWPCQLGIDRPLALPRNFSMLWCYTSDKNPQSELPYSEFNGVVDGNTLLKFKFRRFGQSRPSNQFWHLDWLCKFYSWFIYAVCTSLACLCLFLKKKNTRISILLQNWCCTFRVVKLYIRPLGIIA